MNVFFELRSTVRVHKISHSSTGGCTRSSMGRELSLLSKELGWGVGGGHGEGVIKRELQVYSPSGDILGFSV